MRAIARQFDVGRDALRRHRAHIPDSLLKAERGQKLLNAEGLSEKIAALEMDARRLGNQAEQKGDIRTALTAIRELSRLYETLLRFATEVEQKRGDASTEPFRVEVMVTNEGRDKAAL